MIFLLCPKTVDGGKKEAWYLPSVPLTKRWKKKKEEGKKKEEEREKEPRQTEVALYPNK